ncbi:MAG: calcium-binding protein [Candidatus Limnocylindria bacterium]
MIALRRLLPLIAVAALAQPATAAASSVDVSGNTLHVTGTPGAGETFSVDPANDPSGSFAVKVEGSDIPLTAGAGCTSDEMTGQTTCAPAGVTRIVVDAGDGDDTVTIGVKVPARVNAGAGNDTVNGGEGGDRLVGGDGNDSLHGNGGNDSISGDSGVDFLDAGPGADRLYARDKRSEPVWCGSGSGDRAQVDEFDQPSDACESVDYGSLGQSGRLRNITGGGRFVAIPGQPGERIDRRLLPDILYLIKRFHVRVTDGYSLSSVHSAGGEHPIGVGADFVPGPGGSWDQVDRLARWAEPSQDHPRRPFRWVGYNGDYNHGRGNHLHLSWMHSPGSRGVPVRSVWVWDVRGASASAARRGSRLGGRLGPSRYQPREHER